MDRVGMSTLRSANVNEGFSGGGRSATRSSSWTCSSRASRILDETDSGLDIDALRVVAEGVNRFSAQGDRGVLLITTNTRILRYIKPEFVHVFIAGRVAEGAAPNWPERWSRGLRPLREGHSFAGAE